MSNYFCPSHRKSDNDLPVFSAIVFTYYFYFSMLCFIIKRFFVYTRVDNEIRLQKNTSLKCKFEN